MKNNICHIVSVLIWWGGCDCLKWNIERIGNFVPFDSEERGLLVSCFPFLSHFQRLRSNLSCLLFKSVLFFFSIYINMSIKKLRVRFGSFNIYCMVVFGKFGIVGCLYISDDEYPGCQFIRLIPCHVLWIKGRLHYTSGLH